MKRVRVMLVCICLVGGSAFAEMRIWSDKKGNTIEAEFVSIMGNKVVLKTREDKVLKVPMSGLSASDKKYLANSIPPTIKIDVDVDRDEKKLHDSGFSVEKRETVSCSIDLKKTSKEACAREFTAHAYVFSENLGDDSKKIILHKEYKFNFKNASTFSFSTETASLENRKAWSSTSNGKYGEEYHGYLVYIVDDKGNIITAKANQTTYEKNMALIQGKEKGTCFDENYKVLSK